MNSAGAMRVANNCADATCMASSARNGYVAAIVSAPVSTSAETSMTVQNARSAVKRFKIDVIRFSSSVLSATRRRNTLRASTGRTAETTHSFLRRSCSTSLRPGSST